MIIVTGATGQLGSRIVERLLERVAASAIGVSVRDPARSAGLAARGVRVRRGDYTDAASLVHAFEGASQVLVVSAGVLGEEGFAQHRAAIDAAYAAGVGRIVYTSHMGAASNSLFAPMVTHAATEAYLDHSGMPYTALRNGFYASTLPLLLGAALETGVISAPADGPVSWTTHDDLAAAAAAYLVSGDHDGPRHGSRRRYDGPTPPLTASVALDLGDVARELSALTGRRIERLVVDEGEWFDGLLRRGVPALRAEILRGMFRASHRGEFAAVDPTLASMLGRPPQSARSVLEAHLAMR